MPDARPLHEAPCEQLKLDEAQRKTNKKNKLQNLWIKSLCTSSSCGGWHLQWRLLWQEDLQDGGGVRHRDHFPPHKYIKNTSTCGTTPTEHLLNVGRRPHTSQKARKSPPIPGHLADRVLVLWPGVKPEPLRWESRVQDTGPPETSWPHVISIGKSSPRDLRLNTKTQLHPTANKLQCWMPHAKQLARQEHNTTH